MYEAAAQQAQAAQGAAPGGAAPSSNGNGPDGVVDADFTEVNDDQK